MAWTTPTNPVAGTVITVAYAVTNFINNLNWLRGLTGSADPPGSSYTIRSTSTTSTDWSKVTTDMIESVAVNGGKIADASIGTQHIGSLQVTDAKIANNTINGDSKLVVSSITGNGAGSAIGTDSINVNRISASLTSGEFARITGGGAVVAMANIIGTIPPTKLDATPSGYNAGSAFVISTSNTTAASCNVGIAGVYQIHATFMVKMVANSAVNDANVAFTADLYKSSGIFGPQMRKYLPPVASAPGDGYDSQEYWMHFTIQQAMNASEPIAMVVVKSGGSGGTRCEQAIISAVRIGP